MNGLRKRKKLKVFNFLRKPFIHRLNLRQYARKNLRNSGNQPLEKTSLSCFISRRLLSFFIT